MEQETLFVNAGEYMNVYSSEKFAEEALKDMKDHEPVPDSIYGVGLIIINPEITLHELYERASALINLLEKKGVVAHTTTLISNKFTQESAFELVVTRNFKKYHAETIGIA